MKWSKLKAEEEKNELTAEWVMKPGMNGTEQSWKEWMNVDEINWWMINLGLNEWRAGQPALVNKKRNDGMND